MIRGTVNGHGAVHGLSAGHGNGVIEQNFIGHIDVGGDRLSNRHHARVIIRPVTDISKDVLLVGEWRNAEPRYAFSPHMREGFRVPLHPLRHEMAADSRKRPTTIGYLGGGVMRAARTEIRRALEALRVTLQCVFAGLEKFNPVVDLAAGMELSKAFRDNPGNLGRRQLADGRQNPFAAFVVFADYARPLVGAPIIELFLQLVLDDWAFFLDHEDFFQSFAELANTLTFQRPCHADFID